MVKKVTDPDDDEPILATVADSEPEFISNSVMAVSRYQYHAPEVDQFIANLRESFHGTIEPKNLTFGYRIGILITTCVMVLLPLIYFCILGGFIYSAYAAFESGFAWETSETRWIGAQMAALGAALVVVFPLWFVMLKPLFAKPAAHQEPCELRQEDEPVLFAFVEEICRAVGAPVPNAIFVVADANAGAGFHRGLLGMIRNELSLTIGLPLVASLNTQQLAGVLAHEFGHFSQGTGMRLTFLIRFISGWFEYAVYQRDRTDQMLDSASAIPIPYVWVPFFILRVLVALVRGITWCLMMIGNLIAGYMLRQMEYDADHYEARLAGSLAFSETQWKMNLLQVSTEGAFYDVGEFDRDGRLPDNLPRLIMHNVEQIPDSVRSKMRSALYEQRTSWFDSHPCDGDRLANAMSDNAPGIFENSDPSTQLFSRFDSLSQLITRDFYREMLRADFDSDRIRDTEKLISIQNKEIENLKGLQRFCLNHFGGICSILLPYWRLGKQTPESPAASIELLRQRAVEVEVGYETLRKSFHATLEKYMELQHRCSFVRAGLEASFIKSGSQMIADLQREEQRELKSVQTKWRSLTPFRAALGNRLIVCLELLRSPEAGADERAVSRADLLLSVAKVLQQHHSTFESLHSRARTLELLLTHLSAAGHVEEDEYREVTAVMQSIEHLLRQIWTVFSKRLYPFKHGGGKISMSRFLIETFPDSQNPGEVLMTAADVLEKVEHLNARVFGRLAQLAEDVERLFDFEPLVEYTPQESLEETAQET